MTLQETTFEQAKEETYSRFDKRCRRLLAGFLREKNKAVCAVCSESCSDGEKAQRALRYLVETLAVAAAKRCEDDVDLFVCLLAPYLSTVNLFESLGKGEIVKALADELARGFERVRNIVKEGQNEN